MKLSYCFSSFIVATSLQFLFLGAAFSQATGAQGTKKTGVQQTGGVSIVAIQQQRAVLFQRMLDRPDDLDTAFKYAELSVRAGDLEAAVSTLERMLIFAPGLPRLQLELGLLYFRLNAHTTARSYLEAAISGDNVPLPVVQRVEQLLARISTAEERDVFSAELRAGFRYQTNANRSPENRNINLNGVGFLLAPNAVGEEDTNIYIAGTAHYAKDLESQGDTFEVDFIGYAAKQQSRDELDLVQAEITFGPAFDLGRFEIDNAVMGVYGIASGVFLGDDFYGYAFGAGTRIAAQLSPNSSFLLKGEYRRRLYSNSASSPQASARDGDEFRLAASGNYIVNQNWRLSAGVQGIKTTARSDFYAYTQGDAWFGPTVIFDSPISDDHQAWIANFAVGGSIRRYDEPDPAVNALTEQSDNEVFGRASLTIPVKDNWAVLTEAEYRAVNSNYTTRDHDNFSTTFSVVKRF